MKVLSIVVPVYNEESNVEPLYEAVNARSSRSPTATTGVRVFADNCSTDRTFERLGCAAASTAGGQAKVSAVVLPEIGATGSTAIMAHSTDESDAAVHE
jgi:hypothetical protein